MPKHNTFLLITLMFTIFLTSCNETDITTSTDKTTVTTTQPTTTAVTTTAVTTSTTQDTSAVTFGTQSTEWERELTESEKQALLDEMPEIVFVMSHHYDNTNILGFYITKYGEIKMYDFRTIAPDEIYEIPDVFDRLEEATCDTIFFDEWTHPKQIYANDYADLEIYEVERWYQQLINTSGSVQKKEIVSLDSGIGYYSYYGIKSYESHSFSVVLINSYGENYISESDNEDFKNLSDTITTVFPSIPFYNNFS